MAEIEYHKYLPAYRLLLTPDAKYDYRTHLVVPLSQQDLKSIISKFQVKQKPPLASFRMKYKSLLTDVSRKALILLLKMLSFQMQPQLLNLVFRQHESRPRSFMHLPVEIQIHVLEFVDDLTSYRLCMLTSKRMYQLAKPLLYRKVHFTSTYRFAQFVTCLRVNLLLGTYVWELDLSELRAGMWDVDESRAHDDASDDEFPNPAAIMAGWRDWKFKNNPLYALHPVAAVPLTKIVSNGSMHSLPAQKKTKLTKYFKRRRPSHVENMPQQPAPLAAPHVASGHPSINRFLLNYSNSKDVPIGYLLHVINLCPNLESLNMAGVSLSSDYRIVQPMAHKYQLFDLMNNFHKDLVRVLDRIAPTGLPILASDVEPKRSSAFDLASSASLVFSINTFSKPIRKYNSLLPPLPLSVADLLYLAKGDGRVYMSDLNLRAINNAHLEIVSEAEVFRTLGEHCDKLKYVNLLSIIVVNIRVVRELLARMLRADLDHCVVDGKEYLVFCGRHFQVGVSPPPARNTTRKSELRVLDVTDSGMRKNLQWAQKIDTATDSGQQLIHRILNDEVVSTFEEYVIRDGIRRGRIGENYFV